MATKCNTNTSLGNTSPHELIMNIGCLCNTMKISKMHEVLAEDPNPLSRSLELSLLVARQYEKAVDKWVDYILDKGLCVNPIETGAEKFSAATQTELKALSKYYTFPEPDDLRSPNPIPLGPPSSSSRGPTTSSGAKRGPTSSVTGSAPKKARKRVVWYKTLDNALQSPGTPSAVYMVVLGCPKPFWHVRYGQGNAVTEIIGKYEDVETLVLESEFETGGKIADQKFFLVQQDAWRLLEASEKRILPELIENTLDITQIKVFRCS